MRLHLSLSLCIADEGYYKTAFQKTTAMTRLNCALSWHQTRMRKGEAFGKSSGEEPIQLPLAEIDLKCIIRWFIYKIQLLCVFRKLVHPLISLSINNFHW